MQASKNPKIALLSFLVPVKLFVISKAFSIAAISLLFLLHLLIILLVLLSCSILPCQITWGSDMRGCLITGSASPTKVVIVSTSVSSVMTLHRSFLVFRVRLALEDAD
jgi:hypothetical protein